MLRRERCVEELKGGEREKEGIGEGEILVWRGIILGGEGCYGVCSCGTKGLHN